MGWWRVFVDKLTGRQKDSSATGPRRRRAERYAYRAQVSAKCRSWPTFVELFTGDVSEGGLFVPTDERAEPGERIDVELTTPDGGTVALTGTVVNVISEEQAAQHGKPRGLGVKLEPPDGEARQTFDDLLARARSEIPQPAPADPAGPVIRPPQVDESPIVGIDLGTTYTSVSVIQGKKVIICPWPDGKNSSPSVVAFPDKQTRLVGAEARARLATDPLRTIASPKRLLGRQFDDPEIQGFIGSAPYRTIEGPDGTVVIDIRGQQYAVVQVISYLLEEARKVAETELGTTVERCVMTCPVSFDEARTRLIRRAGQMAGLEVVALIDEPSAAALANRFDPNFGGIVGVYDFGGGTFDFSLVDVSKGDFVVLATAGDTWLGGDDFDALLAEAAANQFWRQHEVDLRKQAVEWQKLMFACERAKRQLSEQESAEIHVPDALRTAEGMIDLRLSLGRAEFERACKPIIDRSLATCDEALGLLDMKRSELSNVYLSGGTTYVPAVRNALKRHFGVPVHTGVPPEHAVCLGAAIHAAQLRYRMARTTLDARED